MSNYTFEEPAPKVITAQVLTQVASTNNLTYEQAQEQAKVYKAEGDYAKVKIKRRGSKLTNDSQSFSVLAYLPIKKKK